MTTFKEKPHNVENNDSNDSVVYILEDLSDGVIAGVYDDYESAIKAAAEYAISCTTTLQEVAEFLSNEMYIRQYKVEKK